MDKYCSSYRMALVWSILLATLYASHAIARNPLPNVKAAGSSAGFTGTSAGFKVTWNTDDIVCRSSKGNIVFSASDFAKKRFIAHSGIKPGVKGQTQDYFYFQSLHIKSLVGPYLSLECTCSCEPYVNGNPDSANPGNDGTYVTLDLRNPQDLDSIVSLDSKLPARLEITALLGSKKVLQSISRDHRVNRALEKSDFNSLASFRRILDTTPMVDFGEGSAYLQNRFLNHFWFHNVINNRVIARLGVYGTGAASGFSDHIDLNIAMPSGAVSNWLKLAASRKEGLLSIEGQKKFPDLQTVNMLVFDSVSAEMRKPNAREMTKYQVDGVRGIMKDLAGKHHK